MLVSNFTESQLDRYEMFRRAAFPKAAIKRCMQTITGDHDFFKYAQMTSKLTHYVQEACKQILLSKAKKPLKQ